MIVRKKNIKNVPLSQMSFQIDVEPEDVYRTLRKYLTQFAKSFPDCFIFCGTFVVLCGNLTVI